MKRIHKILYSFFSFCICGFSIQHADAAQKCGQLRQRSDGATDLYIDGFEWHLYKDAKPAKPNSTLGVCANNQCITISTANFNAACVEYTSVYMLSLYEAEFVNYGCTADYAYTTTKCIQDSSCSTGYRACQSALYHQKGCTAGCAEGYHYSAGSCVKCPTFYDSDNVMLYGSAPGCRVTSSATITRCYIPKDTSAQDASGYFQVVNSNCLYQS